MKRSNMIIAATIAALLGAVALNVTNASSTSKEGVNTAEKSVGWYVANIRDARAQNQICHDDPSIQSTANCVNSLHALEISFKGGN